MAKSKRLPGHDNDSLDPRLTAGLNVDLEEGVEIGELALEYDKPSLYNVRSKIDAAITITGETTGKVYIFPRAGSVVEVSADDLDAILEKRMGGRLCCGDPQANYLFELA